MGSSALPLLLALLLGGEMAAHPRPIHPIVAPAPHERPATFLRAPLADERARRDANHVARRAYAGIYDHPSAALMRRSAAASASATLHGALASLDLWRPPAMPFDARHGDLSAPVAGTRLAGFGPRVRPGTSTRGRHTGVAFASTATTPVHAVAPGMVVHAGPVPGLGNVVIIDHGAGWLTVSAYLLDLPRPAPWPVEEGDIVGVGAGPSPWGTTEVYFEIRHEGIPVDPLPWLRSP